MSRGPGRQQRALLDMLTEHPAVLVVDPDGTEAEQVAQRRAAYALERVGKVTLVSMRVDSLDRRPRLVALRPGSGASARVVHGLDGKHYRQPGIVGWNNWRCTRTEHAPAILRTDAVVTMSMSAWSAAHPRPTR